METNEEPGLRRRPVLVNATGYSGDVYGRSLTALEDSAPAHGDNHEVILRGRDESVEPEGREDEEGSSVGDSDSVHSDDSLIAVSLQKISETVSGIGERMGQLEGKLEKKMGQLGEKVAEIETRLNKKMGELEEKIKEKVEKTRVNIGNISNWAWKSLPFDKLPVWLQDNEYLTHEHRPPMNSFTGCFKSMFRMHTETWNIWTHFLGFIFFVALCLGIYVYGDYITFLFEDIDVYQLPATEQAMLVFFFLAAMICLSCSAMFHLFSNHSQSVYYIFSRLDYSGIAILITGSSIPACYYGFYCSYTACYTHITIIGVLCVGCVVLSLWKKFGGHKYRPLRFATFVLFGVYGVIPSLHVALREGFEKHVIQAGTGLIIMAGLYIFGAVLYVLRVPERFSPGKFNTWASSHQLFHICVVCAALVHYDTLLSMIKYRMSFDSCAHELLNNLELTVL